MKNYNHLIWIKESEDVLNDFWDFVEKFQLEDKINEADFDKINNIEDAWDYCNEHDELKEIAESTILMKLSKKDYREFLLYKESRQSAVGFVEHIKYGW